MKLKPTKHWSSKESLERYFKNEGFIIGTSYCLCCGEVMNCAHPPETDDTKLECISCGKKHSKFTENTA